MRTLLIIFTLLLLASTAAAQSLQEASDSMVEAQQAMHAMDEMGFNTQAAHDLLDEADLAMKREFYGESMQKSQQVVIMKQNAERVDALIKDTEAKLSQSASEGYDVREAQDLLGIAKAKFGQGNFVEAEQFANNAAIAELSRGTSTTRKSPAVEYLEQYWQVLVGAIVLLLILIGIGYKSSEPGRIKIRIKKLENEKKLVKDLIEELHEKYYKEQIISRDVYESQREAYQKRDTKIKQEVAALKSKIGKT